MAAAAWQSAASAKISEIVKMTYGFAIIMAENEEKS
jgi:hypothetical protein